MILHLVLCFRDKVKMIFCCDIVLGTELSNSVSVGNSGIEQPGLNWLSVVTAAESALKNPIFH